MNSSELNDVMLKFINPEVYDIQDPEQKAQYLTEREQFRKYIEAQQVLDEGDLTNFATTETEIETAIEHSSDSLIQQAQQQGSGFDNGRAQFLPTEYANNENRRDRFIQERERFVHIDSADRDQAVFPFQNNYRFDFTKNTFTNVIKIEIVGSNFINFQQLIRNTPASLQNNIIQWQIEDDEDGGEPVTYNAVLRTGNYSADTLQTEIETRMNEVERIDDKGLHDFTVSIDVETDVVSFSYTEFFINIDNDLVNGTGALASILFLGIPHIAIAFVVPHGMSDGDVILLEGVTESVGGVPISVLNGVHTVALLNAEIIVFLAGVPDFTTPIAGGDSIDVSVGVNFKLLFSESDSPAAVLGFPEVDTDFDYIHFNAGEIFLYGEEGDAETLRRLKINTMLAGDISNTTKIRTTLPHLLVSGTRIFIHAVSPAGTTIIPYDHTYGTGALTAADVSIRDLFVDAVATSTGLIITVLDSFTFSVPVPYGEYVTTDTSTISTFIGINVADDDENGDVEVRSANVKLDFNGNQYMFMTSEEIGGDLVAINDNIENAFSKIQLAGNAGDSIYNSYIAGKKIYYDTPLTLLESIDFQFVFNDGSTVEFNDEDHSFVLKITEAIQKVEGTGFSAKIGTRT